MKYLMGLLLVLSLVCLSVAIFFAVKEDYFYQILFSLISYTTALGLFGCLFRENYKLMDKEENKGMQTYEPKITALVSIFFVVFALVSLVFVALCIQEKVAISRFVFLVSSICFTGILVTLMSSWSLNNLNKRLSKN